MSLLGDDGLGYELARKLEICGVWRSWLGESNYSIFLNYLSSPSTWQSFMRTDDSKTRAQIVLQLRARALLFDKASVSLFLRSPSLPSSSSASSSSSLAAAAAPSKLNPTYLQLHGDDVYFSLEDFYYNSQDGEGGSANLIQSKIQPKVSGNADSISQRTRHEELPETWYNQFFEKYKASRQHRLPFGDRESHKRTPEGMSTYIKILERHKRSRKAFKEDQYNGVGNPMRENGLHVRQSSISDVNSSVDDETSFFPEMMFPSNCVPDSALPPAKAQEDNQKVEFYGVLDSLPHVMTRSPAMLERFGIRPEYLQVGLGRSKYRGKNGLEGNGKSLGQEQALQISQKVIARMLANVGFEGSTEVPMEVLSQFLSCHIEKLGRILKVLTDNYRKQCSALEILKMFLQTVGYSNLGTLVEHVKDGIRTLPNPTQQQIVRGVQSGLQPQLQPILQQQQIQNHIHPQMQNLTFQQQQQQWERMRRQQPPTPRAGMNMAKDRPMVQVKIENASDSPMDGNNFNPMGPVNPRTAQMQIRQQQIAAAMANIQAQSGHQFKQLTNLQIPQLQLQNNVPVRAPPVKVEGFQELMGGDGTMKRDFEDHKLTSPSK